jgi:hypothetical protein
MRKKAIENEQILEVDVMAVSMKTSPILKGKDAEKFIDSMNKPNSNADFFKSCKESAKRNFKVK